MKRLILASESPRRREFLALLGLKFDVIPSGFDESLVDTDDPQELVEELALQKAIKVHEDNQDCVVVGSDTIVVCEGQIMGKPGSRDEALGMIRSLSSTRHSILTGVAVIDADLTREVLSEQSFVTFRDISEEELDRYVESHVWEGFAGGYAIQGAGFEFVLSTEGSYSNIIGFPLEVVSDMLERVGVIVPNDAKEIDLMLKGGDI